MARKDEVTGKKGLKGNYRSHALNSTNRTFKLNLKKVTIEENGKKKTVKVSVKTAKTLAKQGKLV